jgi:TonB family protein
MVKPSLIPQPPVAIVPEQPKTPEIPKINENAIPIPEKIEPPKKKEPEPKPKAKPDPKPETPKPESKAASKPASKSTAKPKEATATGNAIPVAEARPGSGGVAGSGAGSGGGLGGGSGISIGTGAGGIGDSWYAQVVERRISELWLRPPEGVRVEIVYSFNINANGGIYNIKQEKSSGNQQLDLNARRAINAASPLSKPPREFQGKTIQFVAQFVHPPDQSDD